MSPNESESLQYKNLGAYTVRYILLPFKLPERGLEPLRISPPDPKSGASANSATLASDMIFEDSALSNSAFGSATRMGEDGN